MDLRPISNYPGYFAGEDGSIYSTLFHRRWNKTGGPRKLKPGRQVNGYLNVGVKQPDGAFKSMRVHRLVCEAFHGVSPEGMIASHLDDNKENNTPANLKWETHKENMRRRIENGIDDAGHRNSRASLTSDQVDKVRILLAEGVKHKDIAKVFGVGRTTITRINTGDRYPDRRSLKENTIKVCKECSHQIPSTRNSRLAKFCSRNCNNKYHNRRYSKNT